MIVVDASAVVDALSGLAGCEDLHALLVAQDLHAPTLLDYEVVSALRGMVLRQELSAARAEDLLTDFEALPVERWEAGDGLRRRAFSLRANLSAYDAAYVALAESLGCDLVTRDARITRAAGHDVRVVVV